jgi:6-phosphogluconolactonase (cycloisomerase 2 family)
MNRRDFAKSAAFLAAGSLLEGAAAKKPVRAYVGTYSSPQGAEGSKGRGSGIYLFDMDQTSGALTQRLVFNDDSNPSWIALNKARTHLYAANETEAGAVSAFSIGTNGELSLLNRASSGGAGPAHLSLHPSEKFLFVANYAGGSVAVLPILGDGKVGEPVDIQKHTGTVGPAKAASGPAGSFAISGHDKPHGHMIESDPMGHFVLAADLGLDEILIYKFDQATGKLTPNNPTGFKLPPGDGPRHFAFHLNRHWFYTLQEESSTLVVCDYDSARGVLKEKQKISTLPRDFAGTNFTSEIVMSPDYRFVYVANRLHDSIAWFAIGNDGKLMWMGEEWTRGDYPRSFTIEPTGNFLYSCNQRSDAIACFRRDKKSGSLGFTGQYTAVGTPAIIRFV